MQCAQLCLALLHNFVLLTHYTLRGCTQFLSFNKLMRQRKIRTNEQQFFSGLYASWYLADSWLNLGLGARMESGILCVLRAKWHFKNSRYTDAWYGVWGKERIVVEHATQTPITICSQMQGVLFGLLIQDLANLSSAGFSCIALVAKGQINRSFNRDMLRML